MVPRCICFLQEHDVSLLQAGFLYNSFRTMVGIEWGPVLWVSIIAGVRVDSLGSSESGVSGLELTIAQTSAMNVDKVSCVKLFIPVRRSMPSKILQVIPITCSQTPPKWEAGGGLKARCFYHHAGTFSTNWWPICKSFTAPTKLVPLSDLNWRTGPLIEMNRRSAAWKRKCWALQPAQYKFLLTPSKWT